MVVYESMFGDNRQVAEAVAAGLGQAGVGAQAVEVGAAPTVIGPDTDLVVAGAPNHAWSLPRPSTRQTAAKEADGPLVSRGIGVREWLDRLELQAGVRVAAFDTRGSHPKVVVAMDHAAGSIEKRLIRLGGERLAAAEAFHVTDMKGPLEPGELERARAWGARMAGLLQARTTPPRP
jgi:hypothetical protein